MQQALNASQLFFMSFLLSFFCSFPLCTSILLPFFFPFSTYSSSPPCPSVLQFYSFFPSSTSACLFYFSHLILFFFPILFLLGSFLVSTFSFFSFFLFFFSFVFSSPSKNSSSFYSTLLFKKKNLQE